MPPHIKLIPAPLQNFGVAGNRISSAWFFDLVHAPVKKNVLTTDATHFVLFEKKRFEFFDAIKKFLTE